MYKLIFSLPPQTTTTADCMSLKLLHNGKCFLNDLNIFDSQFEVSNINTDEESHNDEILGFVRGKENLVITELNVR